jgi:hypothetical protein
MTVGLDDALGEFQKKVDAGPEQVKQARERQDLFKTAFGPDGAVAEIFGSGSLRRSTQLEPVHDVDLVIVINLRGILIGGSQERRLRTLLAM